MTSAPRKQMIPKECWDPEASVPRLFEEQAGKTPDKTAVIYGDSVLTYRDLNERANQLAWKLKSLNAGPNVLVGIAVERSLEIVVGLLGIMKSGAAYVPVDPAYPQERTSYMMQDAGVQILLTQEHIRKALPDHGSRALCLDSGWQSEISLNKRVNPEVWQRGADLAYVIYTSGSTGLPKGAMNTHAGISNRLLWMQQAYGLSSEDRVLQKTPFSFDVSVWEFFWPLITGAKLIVAKPGGHQDSGYLVKIVQQLEITTVHFVPSMLRIFLEEPGVENCKSLRRVICSGEALAVDLREKFFTKLDCELHNLYGPTEAAVDVTFWQCRKDDQANVVPIGFPIANTQMYVLDESMRPVGERASGELYIGGTGVGRGYWRRPELTAERFVPNPFSASGGERLYRTGDLGRRLDDGSIEYLGRTDFQVKIKGFRIELGEIEAALLRHESVSDAVVLAREIRRGDKHLIAYVAPRRHCNSQADGSVITKLQQHLRKQLPEYMVPSVFLLLEKLPLNPNGKIDRRALPDPGSFPMQRRAAYAEPRTAVERKLTRIWETVLQVEEVGRDDDFFDLGGHSLLATQLLSRLRQELRVDLTLSILFANSTIAKLSVIAAETHCTQETDDAPHPVSREGNLPLSFSQERVWFVERLHPGNLAYNYQALLRFEGRLSIPDLERALQEMVRRHEILRTTYRELEGRPVQVIQEPYRVELPCIDLHGVEDPESEMQLFIQQELQIPFDLERLPLIYWKLFRLQSDRYVLLHKEHHMLHDGWSFNLFLTELFGLYKDCLRGTEPHLDILPLQFADFAVWQRQWMTGAEANRQLNFWKQKLADCPSLLELPSDFRRPPVPSYKGAAPRLEIPLDLCSALRTACREQRVTLFMAMFTAYLVLLHRLSGANDICIGSGIANRRWKETEHVIGMVVNNVVLRTDLSGKPTLRTLLQEVKKLTLEASANQDVPFDQVVEALHPRRDPSINPLFQVMFSFHDSPIADFDLSDAKVQLTETISNRSAKWDMNIIVIPRAEQKVGHSRNENTQGITVVWEYSSDLFRASTMQRWMGLYVNLLRDIAAGQFDQQIDQLPLMNHHEQEALLAGRECSRRDYPRTASIPQLFEEQARARPVATAVTYEGQCLTYGELNSRANQLARYLQGKGAGPETAIGVCLQRSLEMAIALLGILKCGAAYVPIDPDYPQERLEWLARDTGMRFMLLQSSIGISLKGVELVHFCEEEPRIRQEPSHNLDNTISPDNLAYVMYTSGSTGAPKGVAVPHRGIVRLVKAANYVELEPKQKVLQFAPLSFDASTLEIWGALLNGAQLIMMVNGKPGLEALGAMIQEKEISTVWLTSGLFRLMVDHHLHRLQNVKQLLAGGDVVPVAHAQRYLHGNSSGRLINGYGPTENTTFTCCHVMKGADEIGTTVPIGRPISNTEVYVLDENLELVPPGVVGELYTGGDGLARGYINDPESTAEKFIPNLFSATGGERLYRTGDLVRYRDDNVIEFLGRKDQQVKIRGFRIEPGEIENVLGQHPQVKECAVLVEDDGAKEKRLFACVLTEPVCNMQDLQLYLKKKLPEYMLPAVIMSVTEIPLTENGKIDRRKLLQQVTTRRNANSEESRKSPLIPPRDDMEHMITSVWTDLLKVDSLGTHENFFEAGGHSLLLMRMVSIINASFGVNVAMREVLAQPTIANLARVVARALRHHEPDDRSILRKNQAEAPASFAQSRLWFVNDLGLENSLYNMPVAYRLKGKLDIAALETSVNEIVRRHEILRTRFRGTDEGAIQVIEPELRIQIGIEDFSVVPAKLREQTLCGRLHEEARLVFDLQQGRLLRLRLFLIAPEECVLLLVMHHIIADGWSLGVFYRELEHLYASCRDGQEISTNPLPIQYADYAVWQREMLAEGKFAENLRYWTKKLTGAPELLALSSNGRLSERPACAGITERFELSENTTEALKQLSFRTGVTLHMTLLAAYAILLYRASGQQEFIIGIPVANRYREQLLELIGFFVNMLPIRVDVSGATSFRELVCRVKEATLEGYAHQELPFERLVEELKPERVLNRNPLFQVAFNMLNDNEELRLADIVSTAMDVDINSAKFDLYFEIQEYRRRLRARLVYSSGLFPSGTGKDICRRFEKLIEQILMNQDCAIGDFDLLLQNEKLSLTEATSIEDLEANFQL